MSKRFCYHSDESYYSDGKYELIRVIEETPGYHIVARYTSLTEAQAVAESLNRGTGLTAEEVLHIRASSMAVSRPEAPHYHAVAVVQFYADYRLTPDDAAKALTEQLRNAPGECEVTSVEVVLTQSMERGDT